MNLHTDEYVDWGISLSIGNSCVFVFDSMEITLESGDIFVANFSKVKHGIKHINDSGPVWFQDGYEYDTDKYINTYGGARASIQIRNVSKSINTNIISTSEFESLYN